MFEIFPYSHYHHGCLEYSHQRLHRIPLISLLFFLNVFVRISTSSFFFGVENGLYNNYMDHAQDRPDEKCRKLWNS